jgi:hypothetical protein
VSYTGWMLPDKERARILALFPPRYENVKATHVTLAVDDETIPEDAVIVAFAYVDDGVGVEALICQVNGDVRRPDGSTFHLTLSVADGRAAKEANDVIAAYAQEELAEDVEITARAFVNRGNKYITTPLTRR